MRSDLLGEHLGVQLRVVFPGAGRTSGSVLAGSELPPRWYSFLYVPEGVDVRTMTYTESRARYAETLDAVVDDCEEVIITRAGHEPVVMLALSEYESLKETAHLLRSPANARRTMAAIDRLEHGGGEVHDLIDPDESSSGAAPFPASILDAAVAAVRTVEGLVETDPAAFVARSDPRVLQVAVAIKRAVDGRSMGRQQVGAESYLIPTYPRGVGEDHVR